MELRTLAYVEAVARLGGFTAAARELHVAQPAVSAQIAQAERELGTRLFVRSHRRTTPTEAGTLVAERARRLQNELAGLLTDVDDLRTLVTGTLRIGATPLLGPVDLPRAATRFRDAHPGVSLRIEAGLIDALLARLANGDLDVVIGPVTDQGRSRFTTHVLHHESIVLIAPASMRPAPARLADTAAMTYVCLGPASGLRAILDDAAEEAGFVPQVAIEVAHPQQIREFVAAGLGVALIARSVAEAPGAEVTMIELDPSPPHPPLGLVTVPERRHRATDAFVAMLRDPALA